MRIKRVEAATMAEALRQVKAALGDEAVLLDTTTRGGVVTVTAAIDDDPPPPGDDEALRHEAQELGGLLRALAPGLGDAPPVDVLAQALAAALPAAPVADARVRLLVGPPGDGKTTALVQLAVRERLAGRRVALVGTDAARVGAGAALSAYGRVLDVPVLLIPDAGALPSALEAAGAAERVFVDTAGVVPGQKVELDELSRLAAAAGPQALRTLVLSGGTSAGAAARVCRAYAALALHDCVVTKLDAAPGAPVLRALWRHRLPVSHLTTGRRIPHDLAPATAERLARCLLAA